MATRSAIIVTGPSRFGAVSTFRLYKHWDGYPTDNLPLIERALHRAQKLIRENDDVLSADTLTGLLIGESVTENSIGAKLEYQGGAFGPDSVGDQGDLEWIYVIDTGAMTLKVYGGSYGARLSDQTKDPRTYVKCLIPAAQVSELGTIEQAIREIEAWGMRVNPIGEKEKAHA